MLKIDNNYEVVGFNHAIRGMRNPKNSWERSDSVFGTYWGEIDGHKCYDNDGFTIGNNDMTLMRALVKGGSVHRKFLRMIIVYADITAPLYLWKEFDTYKVGTVANSCSTMHKIHAKKFTLDDFSHEHLVGDSNERDVDEPIGVLNIVIDALNLWRDSFLQDKDKEDWWQLIQLLPSSYNQKRTVMLNYEVLSNIYHSRKDHKLDEWYTFCDWIEKLPYAKDLIIGEDNA